MSLTWAALARAFAPTGNTAVGRFDTLIVLGSRVDGDGNPKPAMLSRVAEAVREYDRGVAPRMILTGGQDGPPFVEAAVMARIAEAQGVPASAIVVEPEAKDTIHNACFAARIMKARGWRSAEVVTGSFHMARAGIIFSHVPINWRVHAAPPVEPVTSGDTLADSTGELLKTMRYLLYARWADACSP